MDIKTIHAIKSNPVIHSYLSVDSSWYKQLNRNPDAIKELEKDLQEKKRKFEKPEIILVDALTKIDTDHIPYRSIIKGDSKSYSIAAASIIAKVTRDRIMRQWDEVYPMYGFEKHKGYGTSAHITAIKEYGLCPLHRRSFVKNIV